MVRMQLDLQQMRASSTSVAFHMPRHRLTRTRSTSIMAVTPHVLLMNTYGDSCQSKNV